MRIEMETINGIRADNLSELLVLFIGFVSKHPAEATEMMLMVNGESVNILTISEAFSRIHGSVKEGVSIKFAGELIRRSTDLRTCVGGIFEKDMPAWVRTIIATALETIADTYLTGSTYDIDTCHDGVYVIQWDALEEVAGQFLPFTENSVVLLKTVKNVKSVHTFDGSYKTIRDFKQAVPGVKVIARIL